MFLFYWEQTFANPSNTTWYQQDNNLDFYLSNTDQQATFKVSVWNACGSQEAYFPFISIDCSGGPEDPCNQYQLSPTLPEFFYVVVPNGLPPCGPPVLNRTGQKSGAQPTISAIKLDNQNMTLVRMQNTARGSRQSSLNISNLKPGIYTIEITDGKYIERQKVIVL